METIFTQYGITGLIAFLLYIYMKNGFRQQEKLIDNINKLSDNLHNIVVRDTQKSVVTDNIIDDMKKLYEQNIMILRDMEKIINDIDTRTSLCPNINAFLEKKEFSER